MMLKKYCFLINLFILPLFSQTISGHYNVQHLKGIGFDQELTDKAREIRVYKYTYSNSKSLIELTNPQDMEIDTIKRYDPNADYHFETIEETISFSKSKYVKDLKNGIYEKIWVIDGIETYEKIELPHIDWKITDETKKIEGFICKKATANHTTSGYTFIYTAWFCEKIPISDGPFEFGGLPGLIFEISVEDLFICKFTNYNLDANLVTKIDYIKN